MPNGGPSAPGMLGYFAAFGLIGFAVFRILACLPIAPLRNSCGLLGPGKLRRKQRHQRRAEAIILSHPRLADRLLLPRSGRIALPSPARARSHPAPRAPAPSLVRAAATCRALEDGSLLFPVSNLKSICLFNCYLVSVRPLCALCLCGENVVSHWL